MFEICCNLNLLGIDYRHCSAHNYKTKMETKFLNSSEQKIAVSLFTALQYIHTTEEMKAADFAALTGVVFDPDRGNKCKLKDNIMKKKQVRKNSFGDECDAKS